MDYGREVKFGVFVIPATMRPTRALEVASIADELGFDLVGVQDHPYQWRFYDTWTLLVAMAMRTERITVFPDVASLPMRPPAVLAKAAASLDVLSGGRAELGLGAGGFWDAINAMGGAARKLRHLGNERCVFFAPVDDDFVFDHSLSPSSAFKIIARTCLT